MKVLLASNVFNVPSAYGQQLSYLIGFTKDPEIQYGVASLFGVQGGMLNVGGVPVYPAGGGKAGDGNVWAAAKLFDADVIVSFYDPWALQFPLDSRKDIPWVSWTTVDSKPLSPRDRRVLNRADGIVAYSNFGRDVLEEEGYENVSYIPVGIPTELYKIQDKPEAKKAMFKDLIGLNPYEMFLVGMVGRNNTNPSRKGFDTGLIAFKKFSREHPNAHLYLHTEMTPYEMGLDIYAMVRQLGLEDRVLFCDQDQNRVGFSPNYMVQMYNALDLLIQPSQAEGFGLPIIEAMACGTPVIATNHSAMTELMTDSGGWTINSQPMFSPKASWFAIPEVDDLVHKLKAAYHEREHRPSKLAVRRALGRSFVVENYDFPSIIAPQWETYLRGLLES